MALAMSRPWKHPKTGIYWLRKRVPDDLRAVLGRLEEKQSLKTKDPSEAKRKHAEALVAVETQWANLRAGPKTVSEREAHDLVVPIYDWWLAQHSDNPSEQRFWRTKLFDSLWAPLVPGTEIILDGSNTENMHCLTMERWCQEQADGLIQAKGLVVDKKGQKRLAIAVSAAVQRASLALQDMARGLPVQASAVFVPAIPSSTGRPIVGQASARVSFNDLFQGWAKEKWPAPDWWSGVNLSA